MERKELSPSLKLGMEKMKDHAVLQPLKSIECGDINIPKVPTALSSKAT